MSHKDTLPAFPRANRAPAVSVLLAAYNCAPYLPAALDSILSQTFTDFELVVVDDGSTDDTPAILAACARRDARLVLLRNDRNLKLAASLNRGLGVCLAPFVARADGDDLCHPQLLEKQNQFLQKHPRVGVVSCWFERIDAEGRSLGLQKFPIENATIKFKLLWESSISHPGAMYRREVVQAAGGYDESYAIAQDYDLWSRLMDKTEFSNLSEPLLKVRTHAGCSTTVHVTKKSQLARGVSQRLLSRYLGRPLSDTESRALRDLLCAYGPVAGGELPLALGLLHDLLAQAKRRENAITWKWARGEVSDSLLKQAYYRTYTDPGHSWNLLRKALMLRSWRTWCGPCLPQIARLLLRSVRRRKAVSESVPT